MYSQNVYQNQRDLRSSIYIEPVLTSCEECEWNALRTFCFLEVIFTRLERFLSTSVSFCSWIYIEDSPKLPWGMQRICGPSSWITLSFDRLFVLCQALIRFLYFIQVYIFIPPIHSAHYCAFHTSCLHQFLHVYIIITMIIFFFAYGVDQRQARNLISIFNFSSQRPHLNYILLSKVYSLEFP